MTRSTELEQSLTNADREPLVPRSKTRQIRIDARGKVTNARWNKLQKAREQER